MLYKSTQQDAKVQVKFLCQIAEVKSTPTDVLWMPDEQQLLVACANGTLLTFPGTKIIPSTLMESVLNLTTTSDIPTPSESVIEDTTKNVATFFDDSDDENVFGGNSPGDGHGKDKSVSAKQNPFIDDEAEDDDDGSTAISSNKQRSKDSIHMDNASVNTDDMSDTDVASYHDNNREHLMHTDHRRLLALDDLPEKQPPFAPSSSPLDLPRRYLCWNSTGSVTLRHSDGDGITNCRNTIDIHFTDSGVRRPISFTDNLGFILGSVGEDGGIFATDLVEDDDDDDDDDLLDQVGVPGLSETTRQAVKKIRRNQKDSNKSTGSSIYFHRFETFGALREKDWYLTLPNGERALGCATGEGWAAVMTSRRFLRLFSSGGNQGQVLWLDGPPITMVGRYRFVAVFYHQGEPLRDGTQNIGYKLIDATTNCVLASGTASCVSNRATLSWAGFSNDGSLLVMDSEGMISMLVKSNTSVSLDSDTGNGEWVWMPVLDTLGLRKASDDSYWPVTVYDGKLICVPLKGKVKYPDAARRPVTANLSFKLPLARSPLAAMYVIHH